MRYRHFPFSYDQYPYFIREGLSVTDVYKTMVRLGILSFRPNVVLNFSESSGYTDYIRTVSPLVLNEGLKRSVCFTLTRLSHYPNGSYNISDRVLQECNVTVVIARDKISDSSFETLKSLKHDWNVRIVVDTDDDLFAIPPTHPEYSVYRGRLERYIKLLELADVITASTSPVLDGIRKHTETNAEMTIIPNYIDERIWRLKQPRPERIGDTIRILYSGTLTHTQDLLLLQEALIDAKNEIKKTLGKELELVVFGGSPVPIEGMHVVEVPDHCKSYPAFARWIQEMHGDDGFQLAVAPLDTKNPLNFAKSNLKYLEYSAMGIPAIYSDMLPYRDAVLKNITGLLVENSTTNWRDAIIWMASHPEEAFNMGVAAFEDVRNNHLLQRNFDAWANILE